MRKKLPLELQNYNARQYLEDSDPRKREPMEAPIESHAADMFICTYSAEKNRLFFITIERTRYPFAGKRALPGGFVDPKESPLQAAIRELKEETQQSLKEDAFVFPIGIFDASGRDPREFAGRVDTHTGRWLYTGAKVVGHAFLGLCNKQSLAAELMPQEGEDSTAVEWPDPYQFLPWGDSLSPKRNTLRKDILEALGEWVREEGMSSYNADIERAFGMGENSWEPMLASVRYEWMFRAKLLEEAWRNDYGELEAIHGKTFGEPMAFDHREILSRGMDTLRETLSTSIAARETLLHSHYTQQHVACLMEVVSGMPRGENPEVTEIKAKNKSIL